MKKTNLYVVVKFLCIVMLFVNYGFIAELPFLIIQIMAIGLGLWALIQFKWSDLSIFPEPKEKLELITTGPYHLIRNPMYSSLLLYFLAFLIQDFNLIGLNFYILLTICLLLKLNYEEILLQHKFPLFNQYRGRTKKLIPFIY